MNTDTGFTGNDPDPIDDRLRAAGERLRETGPDTVATRQALRRLHETAAGAPVPPERTPWMPWAWAAGLAAAAVIGVVALTARSPQETIREVPADTTPATVPVSPAPTEPPASTVPSTVAVAPASTAPPDTAPPAPTTSVAADPNAPTVFMEYRFDDCFVMSLDAPDRRIGRAVGCIPADALVSDRLFLTLMEGQLYRVTAVPDELDDAGQPVPTIRTFPNWSSASCDLVDAFPPETEPGHSASGLVMELVACSGGERPVALASRIPTEQGEAPEYFTTGSDQFPGGTELSAPVEVTGLIGVEAFYGSPGDGVRCVAVTRIPARSNWREQCWKDADGQRSAPPAVTSIDGTIVQLDLADESAPTAVILDALGLPFTGCSGADIEAMVTNVVNRPSSVMFPSLRCDGTDGVLGTAGVLLHNGPADPGYEIFERADRAADWTHVRREPNAVAPEPYAVLPHALWSQWPGDTTAHVSNRFDVSFGGSSGDPAANAATVAALLDEEADPEFPANARVLATWPQEGIPTLVVVEEDVGGDDSVVGAVHYVHVTGGPNDYRVADWFTSWRCGRGGGPDLCI